MALGDLLKKLDSDGDGFDLKDIKNITKLDFGELLSGDFLQKFTQFGSVKDLLAKVGVGKVEELGSVDENKLNSVAKENSSFGSWQEMIKAAKDNFLK